MAFFTKRRSLPIKVLALCMVPVLLLIVLLTYLFLRNATSLAAELTWVTGAGIMVLLVYGFFAARFVQGLQLRVSAVGSAIENLSRGKLEQGITVNGQDEITAMADHVNTLRENLKGQTSFAEQIKAGNLDVSFDAHQADDQLSQALVKLKENLQTVKSEEQKRAWASDGLNRFVQVLQSTQNVKDLSLDIIKNLVKQMNASQGAVYVVNDGDDTEDLYLEMQACYAYARTKFLTSRIAVGEGIIGQTFLEKTTVYLKDVPDQFVRITSGLGEANPRQVLIVPLKTGEDVIGIVELASFNAFESHEIAFAEQIGENIAHAFLSFRTSERTEKLLRESREQAEQMRSQEEELRQNQEELQATQEEIIRKYDALFKQLGELNNESKFEQLKSINATKRHSVEYYFSIIRNQIITFAENPMVIEAVQKFTTAFYKLDASSADQEQMTRSVHQYYTREFAPRLAERIDFEGRMEELLPTDARTTFLQYQYIAGNPHPTGQKSLLTQATDKSEYSQVHGQYHATLRSFLEKFGYYDIFLLEPEHGDMVYSVFKEVDFGTSLQSGPYSHTNFGKVVQAAMQSNDRNFVQLVDFEPYTPSYEAPASFIACTIYSGEQKVGILVFQMPVDKINQVLTGNGHWAEDGLGETGETCLVGDDATLRSVRRELLVNKKLYLQTLRRVGYNDDVIRKIDKMNTSIRLEEMKLRAVRQALLGLTDAHLETDAKGTEILIAYAPVTIQDVHWVIVSMMHEEEASVRIRSLRQGQ
jgi:HAMP domain-containing protein